MGHHHLPCLRLIRANCDADTLSFAGRMAKSKAIKKQPDTWETVCQVTNTVLEVAKVQGSSHSAASTCILGVHPPQLQRHRSFVTGPIGCLPVQPVVHFTFIPLIIVIGMTMTGGCMSSS